MGDEGARGAGFVPTVISGCGNVVMPTGTVTAAVQPGESAVIAGFTITCASGSGVAGTSSGTAIRNNTITGNGGVGIDILNGSTNHVIAFNTITSNSTGIRYESGVAGGKAENNTIIANSFGVVYVTVGGDLGGGPASSAGANVISCNTSADLSSQIRGTLSATNNRWDHVPPTMSTSGATGGVDV